MGTSRRSFSAGQTAIAQLLEPRTLLGAHLVKDIRLTDTAAFGVHLPAAMLGDVAYFAGSDGVSGEELWRTDGTVAGTYLLNDISPGADFGSPNGMIEYNGALYFMAYKPGVGGELWRSDGTAKGTQLFKDFVPGDWAFGSGFPKAFVKSGGLLYFDTVVTTGVPTGREIWRTDGTVDGTIRLARTANSANPAGDGVLPALGKAFFIEHISAEQRNLWVTDGTPAGTSILRSFGSIFPYGYEHQAIEYNGYFCFIASPASGKNFGLWRTDGTPAGTVQLPSPIPNGGILNFLAVYQGRMIVNAYSGADGAELWSTDGTPENTYPIKNIRTAWGGSYPRDAVEMGGKLYFIANDGPHGAELWVTNGTEPGTTLVRDIHPDNNKSTHGLLRAGDRLYFFADDGVHGEELWQSDGTFDGTSMVQDVRPGAEGSSPANLVDAGQGAVFFTAKDGVTGIQLWMVDPPARLSGGTLKISGDDSADAIEIHSDAATITALVSGRAHVFSADAVKRLVIEGFAGNDSFRIDHAVDRLLMKVNGGDGDDCLSIVRSASPAVDGAVAFDGGPGSDSVSTVGDTRGCAYTISVSSFFDGAPDVVLFSTIEEISLHAGAGDDRILVTPDPVVAFTIDGGAHIAGDSAVINAVGSPLATSRVTVPGNRPIALRDIEDTAYAQVSSVVESIYDRDAPVPQLRFAFDRDGPELTMLSIADILVLDLNHNTVVTPRSLSYDADTRTLLAVLAPEELADSQYLAVLRSGGAFCASLRFFTLRGDANGDRLVDSADLDILVANWQQSSRLFSQCDFNYDGRVDITDLALLSSNWQERFPVPLPPTAGTRQFTPIQRVASHAIDAIATPGTVELA